MNYWEFLLRVLVATVLGGLIGIERETKHRPAGLRTHVLVCLGAMSVMALSDFIFVKYYDAYGVISDPSRLGAQVISGIGFLGAGTIIHHGVSVRGLTTAASLWAVACIGLCIGAGFYFGGIVLAAAMYFVLLVMNRMSHYLDNKGNFDYLVTLSEGTATIGLISLCMAKSGIKVVGMEMVLSEEIEEVEGESECIEMRLKLKPPHGMSYQAVARMIESVDGVIRTEAF